MSSPALTSNLIEFPVLRDPRYPVHRIADQLEPYLRLIIERFQPERLILFGSQAYGEPDEHSDIDLLVIRRGITSERDSNIEIRRTFDELPDRHNFSFTILSKTPERIADRLTVKSPFYEDIVGKGLELYAKQADG
jgi:predicted nucleotidyltransferase